MMVPETSNAQLPTIENYKECCVCGAGFSHAWNSACKHCEPVWNICFTSAEDGARSAKSASLETLHAAFGFEMKRRGSRKKLRVAIAREIAKRMKEAKR